MPTERSTKQVPRGLIRTSSERLIKSVSRISSRRQKFDFASSPCSTRSLDEAPDPSPTTVIAPSTVYSELPAALNPIYDNSSSGVSEDHSEADDRNNIKPVRRSLTNHRGLSNGALSRLERQMSKESVASLHTRQQQHEQRLLNHVVGGTEPSLCKSSFREARTTSAHGCEIGAADSCSKQQDMSLKGLVAEFEQTFL